MRGLADTGRTIIGAACLLAALLALAVRLAVPAGYMPQRSADGWTITICTGQGPATLTIGEDGRPVPPDHAEATTCPYALLATPLSAAPPLLLALPILLLIAAGPRLPPRRHVAGAVRWRPPAQAPPLSVA